MNQSNSFSHPHGSPSERSERLVSFDILEQHVNDGLSSGALELDIGDKNIADPPYDEDLLYLMLTREDGEQIYKLLIQTMLKHIIEGRTDTEEVKSFADLIGNPEMHIFYLQAHSILKEIVLREKEKRAKGIHTPGSSEFDLFIDLFDQRWAQYESWANDVGVGDQSSDDDEIDPATAKYNPYGNGLVKVERRRLKKLLFGDKKDFQLTKKEKRLYRSHMNMGYVPAALQEAWSSARAKGFKDLERDINGLPMNLRLPGRLKPMAGYNATSSSFAIGVAGRSTDSTNTAVSKERMDAEQSAIEHHLLGSLLLDDDSDEGTPDLQDGKSKAKDNANEQKSTSGQQPPSNTSTGGNGGTGTGQRSVFTENFSPSVPTTNPTGNIASHPAPPASPVVPAATDSAPNEPAYPLRTATEVEAFQRTRSQNLLLPQVPSEPPEPAWTGDEVLWRREMNHQTKEVVEKKKKEEKRKEEKEKEKAKEKKKEREGSSRGA